MASIVANAELGIDYYSQYGFIKQINFLSLTGMSIDESILASVSKSAIEFSEDLDGNGVIDSDEVAVVIVFTHSGRSADLISKYRPSGPVLVVSDKDEVIKKTNCRFGQHGYKIESLENGSLTLKEKFKQAFDDVIQRGYRDGFIVPEKHVLAVSGVQELSADVNSCVSYVKPQSEKRNPLLYLNPGKLGFIQSLVTTRIHKDLLVKTAQNRRATKIVCTMGPACWSEEAI
eukprot:266800-Hanusia_phi.AAC.1